MSRWWAVILACACGQSAGVTVWVGTARDGDDDVSIALVSDGEHVAAYVCADDAARDPYPGWFSGEVAADGHFDLALGGYSLSGSLADDAAQGRITEPDGTVVDWTSARASQSTLTGVYKGDSGDGACSASVIVVDDDSSRPPIVRGAWCNVMQVTPVLPIALVDDRIAVNVLLPTTPERIYVSPVRTVPRP